MTQLKQKIIKNGHMLATALMLSPIALPLLKLNSNFAVAHADDDNKNISNTGSSTAGDTSGGGGGSYYNETYTPLANGAYVWLIGKTTDGAYMYCLNAGLAPAKYKQTLNKLNSNSYELDKISNIIACGLSQPGHKPLCPDIQSYDEKTQQAITQIAVWDALGQGGAEQVGDADMKGQTYVKTTVDAIKNKAGLGNAVGALINYAASHQANQAVINDENQQKNIGNQVNQLKNQLQQQAQQQVNQDANNAINSWKTSAHSSLQNAMTNAANQQFNQLDSTAKSTALTMVHFTQESLKTSPSDAKLLPDYYKNDDAQGASASVKLGAHIFKFKLSHDNVSKMNNNHISNVTFGDGEKVSFTSALPKDTVILNNGSVVTSDASSTKDYDFKYGEVELQIPFSDEPATSSDTMIGSGVVTGTITTDVHSSAVSSQVTKSTTKNGSVSVKGYSGPVAIPYRTVEDPKVQTIGVVISDSVTINDKTSNVTASASATASGAASASAQKTGSFSQPVQQSLSFKWNSVLTSFAIEKTDQFGHPLRGVTFELVQSSVADSNVLTDGPGHYKLASGNGELISLPKVTDKDGKTMWSNLPFGVYTLLEIQTNTGYIKNTNPVDLTADRYHADIQHVHVINNKIIKPQVSGTGHAGSSSVPTIHTSATGNNNTKYVLGNGQQSFSDTIIYDHLTPNHEYTVSGHFVNQDTGKDTDLKLNGSFKSSSSGNGQVTVSVTGNAAKYAGQNIVALETVSDQQTKKTVAVNNNIHDTAETLHVTKPEISTTATVDGKKSIQPNGMVSVQDVVQYQGMVPGVPMEMDGQAHNKDNGDAISGVYTQDFTPSSESGTTTVTIKADASKMGQKGMVMFEKAYQQKPHQLIATHEDINSPAQSINRVTSGFGASPTTPTKPTSTKAVTQTHNTPLLARTAEEVENHPAATLAMVGAVILVTAGGLCVDSYKKK